MKKEEKYLEHCDRKRVFGMLQWGERKAVVWCSLSTSSWSNAQSKHNSDGLVRPI